MTVKAGLTLPGLGRLPHASKDSRGLDLTLGADVGGKDPLVQIYLQAQKCEGNRLAPEGSNGVPIIAPITPCQIEYPDLGWVDRWEMETGGLNENMWLKWMNYTAQAQGKPNCVICAAGRPTLTTAPARITPFNSKEGFACLLELFVDGRISHVWLG